MLSAVRHKTSECLKGVNWNSDAVSLLNTPLSQRRGTIQALYCSTFFLNPRSLEGPLSSEGLLCFSCHNITVTYLALKAQPTQPHSWIPLEINVRSPPPPQKKTAVTTEADSKGQHLECQHGHDCYASSDMSPSLNHQGAVQKDGTWTGRASPAPLPPLPGRDGEDGRVILPLLEGG